MGVRRIQLLDFDRVELHNRDRLLHAGPKDVGRLKVEVLADALRQSATAEGFEVESLDLVTGFDVSDPEQWEEVGPVEVACLNAGVVGGPPDPADLSLDGYRRAIDVNVDGVVLGVRRLARVMPSGGRIVCTASLAGLTAVPDDPVYALTKHAVVGFVRSAAGSLARRGISINAVCPGFADTPMVAGAAREALEGGGLTKDLPRNLGVRNGPVRRATDGLRELHSRQRIARELDRLAHVRLRIAEGEGDEPTNVIHGNELEAALRCAEE